jgi:rfaE bifunctional protein kinase chain/domain
MEILDAFSKAKVLVVGDVMLDRYWWGSVSRISPEAPVPVVRMDRTTLAPGGAANVAVNVAGLGAQAMLVGIIGEDTEADLLPEMLSTFGVSDDHLVRIPGRHTTTKTRIIAHSQQVARIDQETTANLPQAAERSLLDKLTTLIEKADAVVISDYAKGLLSDTLLRSVIELSNQLDTPVLVDPKGKDYSKYRGASLLTPNRREAADACGLEESDQEVVDIAGKKLLDELDLESVLITQGEDGMTLFRPDVEPHHLNTLAREVYDVTGAGDTVIACLGVAIGAGANLETAAEIANTAAGFVVEQVGTTAITIDHLREGMTR